MSDVGSAKSDGHGEVVGCSRQVAGSDGQGSSVSRSDAPHEELLAVVLAFSADEQRVRNIVNSEVENNTGSKSDHSRLDDIDAGGESVEAVIKGSSGATGTSVPRLDLAVSGAAVAVIVVSVVAREHELHTIATFLLASARLSVVGELRPACDARVAAGTAEAARRTSQAHSVVCIKVSSYTAPVRAVGSNLGALRDAVSSNLGEAGIALAQVGDRNVGGVGLVGAEIALVSIGGTIAHALQVDLGEPRPAQAHVVIPVGIRNDCAGGLGGLLTGSSSIESAIRAGAPVGEGPHLLVGTGDAGFASEDLSGWAGALEVDGVPDSSAGTRDGGQALSTAGVSSSRAVSCGRGALGALESCSRGTLLGQNLTFSFIIQEVSQSALGRNAGIVGPR